MTVYKHNPTPWHSGWEHENEIQIEDANGVHVATVHGSRILGTQEMKGNARLLLDAVAALKAPSPSQSSTPTGGLTEAELADAELLIRYWKDDPNVCNRTPGVTQCLRYAEALAAEVRRSRALGSPGERTTGGSTLPGAMQPEFVHARSVTVALQRIAAGEPVADVERDYGFPGGMLAGAPGETTDTRAALVSLLPLLEALNAGDERWGLTDSEEDALHLTRTLASPSPQTHDEGDKP